MFMKIFFFNFWSNTIVSHQPYYFFHINLNHLLHSRTYSNSSWNSNNKNVKEEWINIRITTKHWLGHQDLAVLHILMELSNSSVLHQWSARLYHSYRSIEFHAIHHHSAQLLQKEQNVTKCLQERQFHQNLNSFLHNDNYSVQKDKTKFAVKKKN